MNLTIMLDEPFADQLREAASARSLTPEQAARDILGAALSKIVEEERWRPLNQRRRELIRMSRECGLTPEEQSELDRLQAILDARLEAVDEQMIAAAEAALRSCGILRGRIGGVGSSSGVSKMEG
jgi:hypothetical protein